SAVPRFQPRQSCHFSACTFSRPMARILAMPQSMALCASGVPVTRAPTLSLSSVRYWKACEFIIPSPAILTNAGLVPSSSGPLKLSFARAITAQARLKPNTEIPRLTKDLRIRSIPPRLLGALQTITSDARDWFRFQLRELRERTQKLTQRPACGRQAQSTQRFAERKKNSHRRRNSGSGNVSFRKPVRESSLYVIFATTYTANEAPVRRLP